MQQSLDAFKGKYQNYQEISPISGQGYSSMYIVEGSLDQKKYFLKKFNNNLFRNREQQFIEYLYKIQKLLGVQEYWQNDFDTFLILEYCEGGDVAKILKERKLSECELKSIILDIGDQLEILHKFGLIHQDVKPHNIVKKEKKIANKIIQEYKLCDFGSIIKNNREDSTQSRSATIEYMPPESIDDPEKCILTFAVDIWSFGVTIFELMTEQKLLKLSCSYQIQKKLSQYKNDQREVHSAIDELIINQNLNQLLKQMIHPLPQNRPTIVDVNTFFKEYFKDVNIEEQQSKNVLSLENSPAQKKSNSCICNNYHSTIENIRSRVSMLMTTTDDYDDEKHKEVEVKNSYLIELAKTYQKLQQMLQNPP